MFGNGGVPLYTLVMWQCNLLYTSMHVITNYVTCLSIYVVYGLRVWNKDLLLYIIIIIRPEKALFFRFTISFICFWFVECHPARCVRPRCGGTVSRADRWFLLAASGDVTSTDLQLGSSVHGHPCLHSGWLVSLITMHTVCTHTWPIKWMHPHTYVNTCTHTYLHTVGTWPQNYNIPYVVSACMISWIHSCMYTYIVYACIDASILNQCISLNQCILL